MPPMKKSPNVSRLKSLSRSKDSNFQRTNRAIESAGARTTPSRNKAPYEYQKAQLANDNDPLTMVVGGTDPEVMDKLVKNVGSSMKRTAQPMSSRQAIQILREHMKDLSKRGRRSEVAEVMKLIDKLTGQASIDRKIRRGGKVNVSPKDPTRRRAIRDRQLDDDTVDKFLAPYKANY